MIHPIGLVDTLAELPQMSLLFSMNLCPKYVCMSPCSNYLPFEVCEFPIVRNTHPRIVIQWNLVRDLHMIMEPNHGLVQEIRGFLYLNQLFVTKSTKTAGQSRLSKFEAVY